MTELNVIDNAMLQKRKGTVSINESKIEEVAANQDLNDKQQLFCIYYLKYFNTTNAYKKAYEFSYNTE